MSEAIEFYFDFSSPYGYLASEKIDELAARYGRKVRWHPILLGIVFRESGGVPLTLTAPIKSNYYPVSYTHLDVYKRQKRDPVSKVRLAKDSR